MLIEMDSKTQQTTLMGCIHSGRFIVIRLHYSLINYIILQTQIDEQVGCGFSRLMEMET